MRKRKSSNQKLLLKLVQELKELKETIEGFEEPVLLSDVVEHEFDKPVCIVFLSDLHVGSVHSDYERLEGIVKELFSQEGVYVVINGDLIDNFDVPVPKLALEGASSQILSPAKQRAIAKKLLMFLKDKLLAFVIGNHEEFSSLDFLSTVKVPMGLNRLVVELKIGKKTYNIAIVHKSRFNSIINPTHAGIRQLHLLYPYADVIALGHTHAPTVATVFYPKDMREGLTPRIILNSGSLKNLDAYTYKHFNPYPVSNLSVPAVVFTQERAVPFARVEDALLFYKAISHVS